MWIPGYPLTSTSLYTSICSYSPAYCHAGSHTSECCTSEARLASAITSTVLTHYVQSIISWAKSTIFIDGPISALLKDAGNIPVDRKNKDNQKLFSGTFEALKAGEAVAIFPEGTSYTEPRLQEIKDGASWVRFS